jgi:ABC-type antimicrobial peptide transport system permease subunit
MLRPTVRREVLQMRFIETITEFRFRTLAKHALIIVFSVLLGFPIGFLGAFFTSPAWDWFERATGIESLGHSGPADWVFTLMILICSAAVLLTLEWAFRNKTPKL